MRPAAFLARQWPKRHEYLVEECVAAGRVLHVNDVLPMLTGWHRDIISRWTPSTHPGVTLVPRMGGPFRRWWFVCPGCKQLRDALYALPAAPKQNWRCRRCLDLIYASQRHGPRHPASRVLTRRKRTRRLKSIVRQERRRARIMADQCRSLGAAPMGGDEEAITVLRHLREQLAERALARQVISQRTRELIAGETERCRATLRELSQSAVSVRVRAGARRALGRDQARLKEDKA